jgi:asparaginyl-tRNA synthetase
MKNLFIESLLNLGDGTTVVVPCWLQNKRTHGNVVFLDVCDSTGCIQVIADSSKLSKEDFASVNELKIESAIEVTGKMQTTPKGEKEVSLRKMSLIGSVDIDISPSPRSNFDIFDVTLTNQLLKYRHLYLRNPKIMAIMHLRDLLKKVMREWFDKNSYFEFDAPILVPVPLYDGSTAIDLKVKDDSVYLTQCAGFYLEAGAHSFEKVYNMGPSFRGEESRSKRHLIEYWHIKAEQTWGDREDIIKIVEDIFKYVTERFMEDGKKHLKVLGRALCLDGLKTPFPRLTYQEAVKILQENGRDFEFGTSLGNDEEVFLSERFNSPFWVFGIPREVEPFPYCLDPKDLRVTMVADLIANNGYGELLGVAEKISDMKMLEERMRKKNKWDDPSYDFIRDVHKMGSVPHIAFGMGLERMLRWLIDIPHVRDCIPFPRVVRRKIMP